jgi:hypothetical protein
VVGRGVIGKRGEPNGAARTAAVRVESERPGAFPQMDQTAAPTVAYAAAARRSPTMR